MNPFRARFSALSAALFERPATPTYCMGALFAMLLAGGLVYGDSPLPEWAKTVVMAAALLCISRLFSSTPLRVLWATLGGLLGLVLVLEAAALAAS